MVRLQRKPPGATVERLGRRDNAEFAALRSQAARSGRPITSTSWLIKNPRMPDLNDRAADNWRPLLAIADLAGGTWPKEARRAACLLSGEEQDGAIGVELLRDIRSAFGDGDVIRSSDLVAQLTADPERPWAEWKHRGRPLTQKQLAGLLALTGAGGDSSGASLRRCPLEIEALKQARQSPYRRRTGDVWRVRPCADYAGSGWGSQPK